MTYKLSEEEKIQLSCPNRDFCIKIRCTPNKCPYKVLENEVTLWKQEFGGAKAPEVKLKHYADIAILNTKIEELEKKLKK
jgi:hypothetical protein